jgi:hypothetical protein
MALIPNDGNPDRHLNAEDFNKEGDLKTTDAELALVVGSATKVEAWLMAKQLK